MAWIADGLPCGRGRCHAARIACRIDRRRMAFLHCVVARVSAGPKEGTSKLELLLFLFSFETEQLDLLVNYLAGRIADRTQAPCMSSSLKGCMVSEKDQIRGASRE